MTVREQGQPLEEKRHRLGRLQCAWVPVALAVFLLLTGCTTGVTDKSTPTPTPTATATPASTSVSPALSALPSIADLVSRVEPAVVSIQVKTVQRGFYGDVESTASGSGVIFRDDGYVLTNNHVVDGGTSIMVALIDGRELEAKIVGTDRSTDLAVIKVEASGLPTAPLGDASKLRPGDWVVAIGNALGFKGGPSVTLGVVSALGRSLQTEPEVRLLDLIQTDAAINRGNSGGPLINLQGEVVGINTAVLRDDQAEGIGFAVSTGIAIPIAEQLVRNGRVVRPYLGIYLSDIDFATAAEKNLSTREGVLITRTIANGPAERAGIKANDVIVALDNQPIPSLLALHRLLLNQFKVGQRVTATVLRGTDRKEFALTLGESPR